MAELQPVPQWALPFIGNEEKMAELGLKFNPVWLKWFIDTLTQVTDGSLIEHNTLQSIQGGSAAERYHLNAPGAAGTFARSDGTDWQNSTLTLPNTLTVNQVLYGTSTNVVGSSANLTFDGTNLGVGTATPAVPIDLRNGGTLTPTANTILAIQHGSSNAQIEILTLSNLTGRIAFSDNTSLRGRIDYSHNLDAMSLWTASAERVRITNTGRVGIGETSPTGVLHLKAGTATASTAPLKFNSGTSLTTPEAGAVEFTTDNLFFTITTGPARKRLLMADPVGGLTSGRIPYATTNGRLTDNASMVFDGTNLVLATKEYFDGGFSSYIDAAGTGGHGNALRFWAGNGATSPPLEVGASVLTLADSINVAFNTGTGTKLGTATSQKLSLWNATPIVQPTAAIAAATFVANTSGIADDTATFDGYTLGQVVKALRDFGALA